MQRRAKFRRQVQSKHQLSLFNGSRNHSQLPIKPYLVDPQPSKVVTIGNDKSCVLSFRCQSCLSNSSASHQRCSWPTVRNKDASFGIPPCSLTMEGHCHFQGQTFGESSLVASVANWVQAGSARLTFYLETLVKLVSLQDKRILLFTVSRIYSSMPVLELKSPTKMKTANSISKIRRQTNCQFCVPETKELIHSLQKGGSCWTNHGLALFLHLLHIGKGVEHECTEQENAAKVGWLGLNTPNIPLAFQELNDATIWEGALLFQEQQVHNQQAAHSHLFMQKFKSAADLLKLTRHYFYQRNAFMCVKSQCSCLT